MRIFSLSLLFALFLSCSCLQGAFAASGKNLDSPAAAFVQKLGDKALTSLTAHGLPKGERARRVRTLLRENFDIRTIGRFVLGPHWNEATDAQRSEYVSLFEDMIVETYTQRFAEYSGQSFKVLGTEGSGGNDTTVASQIVQKDGPPVDVKWRVRNKDGSMKIVDVLVDEISMSVTQRADFDGVIQAGGGNIEALLISLRKHKVAVAGTK